MAAVDFEALRDDFPNLADGQPPLHYLDSAASTQKPACVIESIRHCYAHEYGPVHRGLYPLAENASENYEAARRTLARFINAGTTDQVVFTRSATEAINLVASGWAATHLQSGDEIWVSQMEHHSNFLPWQRVCNQRDARLRIIPVDDRGRLDLENAPELFGPRSRLIAISQMSNVLGTINPVREVVEHARRHDIPVLVDAAQSVGHMPVDVQELDCDFLVASAHKMCGPTGIGFLYGTSARLRETEPLLLGGGMVDEVGIDHSSWAEIPARFEAGSPNLAGAVGLATAVDYLSTIGLKAIEQRVRDLTDYAYQTLEAFDEVLLYGPETGNERGGILSFNIEGIHPHDVAQVAGEQGVAIRAGHHCCQPLMQRLGVSSTARASLNFYNNEQDISALADVINETVKLFGKR
ncbi:MAG: SufS family cysteine desulfurase [Gammaproteobacteria bacterium]|nr:SufS family cysteine desulfurase [Gammaproteobacteria bacterium]